MAYIKESADGLNNYLAYFLKLTCIAAPQEKTKKNKGRIFFDALLTATKNENRRKCRIRIKFISSKSIFQNLLVLEVKLLVLKVVVYVSKQISTI